MYICVFYFSVIFLLFFFLIVSLVFVFQLDESAADVEVPQSFFSTQELKALIDQTKPEWIPAAEYFDPKTAATGKIGRGGLFVEEPVTGTRLRRLNNGTVTTNDVIDVNRLMWFARESLMNRTL